MSIANRVTDLENRISRLYAERRKLNQQVMDITRRIKEHEDQLEALDPAPALSDVTP